MNPWNDISLSDYENHMSLSSVLQLQTLNIIMKEQIRSYDVSTLIILGVAGGNGLEYAVDSKLKKIYGIDVNKSYLEAVKERYEELKGKLECLCIDLLEEYNKIPKADFVIANLLIEYVGYEVFQKVLNVINPKFISCVIQENQEEEWISDSPYEHCFEGLETIHHFIEERELINHMVQNAYLFVEKREYRLPNGKKFIRMDFADKKC